MGCDIHVCLEVKINGEWILINHPNVGRDYSLFGKMAGVRDLSVKPISLAKGLPDDISKGTKHYRDWWGAEGHSDSWLNIQEIEKLAAWHNRKNDDWHKDFSSQFGYLHGDSIYNFRKYRDAYPKEIESVRIVFWFDN